LAPPIGKSLRICARFGDKVFVHFLTNVELGGFIVMLVLDGCNFKHPSLACIIWVKKLRKKRLQKKIGQKRKNRKKGKLNMLYAKL
jgi:hypothetical protein